MANVLVFLSDLQAGRSSSTVEVRLLRSWEAKNIRRGGERMCVDMLLLDSQVMFYIHRLFNYLPIENCARNRRLESTLTPCRSRFVRFIYIYLHQICYIDLHQIC